MLILNLYLLEWHLRPTLYMRRVRQESVFYLNSPENKSGLFCVLLSWLSSSPRCLPQRLFRQPDRFRIVLRYQFMDMVNIVGSSCSSREKMVLSRLLVLWPPYCWNYRLSGFNASNLLDRHKHLLVWNVVKFQGITMYWGL